jgi:hypothetical protein
MAHLPRFVSALLVTAAVGPFAYAQAPPAAKRPPARPQVVPSRPATTKTAPRVAQGRPQRRSIVHHYPYPYPSYYNNDRTGGFRNPGGVGRYREYYPPGDPILTQPAQDPVRVATFGRGGGPTLADQRAAQQIGIQRENAIMNHIDSYARPYYGYGYGVGYFGGFN